MDLIQSSTSGEKRHTNTPHGDDECSCVRCQHPSQASSFGFRDPMVAEDVTRQLARCQVKSYWLVRSHMGIWYYAAAPHQAGYLPRRSAQGFEEIMARSLQADIIEWLGYLGCEIVKTFDLRGDEVKV